jgi:D-serine deaminase-like pyridoxal phosphate-dependent protein
MIEQAQGISQVGEAASKKIPVLIKIDSGLGRFGVLPGEPTLELAGKVNQLSGVSLMGVLTHKSVFREKTREDIRKVGLESASVAAEVAQMLRKEGFAIRDVAVGCTATFEDVCDYYKKGYFPEVTEVHPGGGVLIDPLYINNFYGTEDDCAITVLATVISTPAPNRAVLDVGARTLSNDTLAHLQWKPDYLVDGRPSYGIVKGRPDLRLGRLNMEVSVVYPTNLEKRPTIGDQLEIIPNMVNIATNFQEKMYAVRKGEIEGEILLTGRGLSC